MTEFMKKLNTETNGRYDFLRLNSAVYFKPDRKLVLKLIYPNTVEHSFLQADRDILTKVVQRMYDGAEVDIRFLKTCSDNGTVKNKIIEYLNAKHKLVFEKMGADDVTINANDSFVKVVISSIPPIYSVFNQTGLPDKLKVFLEKHFCSDCTVEIRERLDLSPEERRSVNEDGSASAGRGTISVVGDSLVPLKSIGAKAFGKGKRAYNLNLLPVQISTVKEPSERRSVAICGTVSGVTESQYRNKKYNPDEPTFKTVGKTKIPHKEFNYYYRWFLNDTTGNIECISFSDDPDEDIKKLQDGDIIVVLGGASKNSRDGSLNFIPDGGWYAEVDFESINPVKEIRSENSKYNLIHPEKYVEMRQSSLFEILSPEEEETPKYLSGKTIVVFDFETTGLDPARDKIIEIGACKIVNGKIVETFSSFVNPGRPVPPEITALTGITNSDVADAPVIESIIPDFFKFTRGASLAAHNISFDFPFLKNAGEPLGYVFGNELIDTLALARVHVKGQANNKLGTLCEHMGVSLENAHRAIDDACATAKLLQKIAKLI